MLPGFLCVLGARDIATGQQLWEAIKSDPLHAVMSDYWKPYEHMIPQALHTRYKAETPPSATVRWPGALAAPSKAK